MDSEFKDYFRERADAREDLRARMIEEQDDGRVASAVETSLATARERAGQLGFELRGDAELVIAFLAEELVARPLAAVSPDQVDALNMNLQSDVVTILDEAERSGSVNEGEVSAHAVIDGLSGSWATLLSGVPRLWDRHRGSGGQAKDDRPEAMGPGGSEAPA